jgi:CRP-like cAMP-binding protein
VDDEAIERNDILAAVEPDLRERFEPAFRPMPLQRGQTLYSVGAELDRVTFPLRGLIGIQAETADGGFVESALVGREGAIGAFEACGSRQYMAEAVVQIAGRAVQMSAAAYRELFEASPAVRTAVHIHVEQLLSETRQFVVCNTLHSAEQRLIRTLLEARDKSGAGDTLPLTQDMLGRMLGLQRTTVALILGGLEEKGVLERGRGALTLNDIGSLEHIACSCRAALRHVVSAIGETEHEACESVVAA